MITNHHVYPPPTGAAAVNDTVQEVLGEGNASVAIATTTAPGPGLAGYEVGYWPLILFLVLLVVASLLLLSGREENPPHVSTGLDTGLTGVEAAYEYRGLRAGLRRLFLQVRGAAEESYGQTLRHATPGELAALIGGPAGDFSREYSRGMYSRSHPVPGEVERVSELARRVLEWLSRGREG